MSVKPRVLIVEDDAKLRDLLSEYLTSQGFDVRSEQDGLDALLTLRTDPPDVVILDLMLPGLDGFEVCRKARDFYHGGIVMLTARQTSIDQAVGLEIGADDYIVKPVEPRILLARLRSLLRRLAPGTPVKQTNDVTVGPISLCKGRREVSVQGKRLDLTSVEFDVFWFLGGRVGEVVSRDELYREVRGTTYDGIDRGMDIHVSRIRRKIAASGGTSGWIKSVRGVGYMLVQIP